MLRTHINMACKHKVHHTFLSRENRPHVWKRNGKKDSTAVCLAIFNVLGVIHSPNCKLFPGTVDTSWPELRMWCDILDLQHAMECLVWFSPLSQQLWRCARRRDEVDLHVSSPWVGNQDLHHHMLQVIHMLLRFFWTPRGGKAAVQTSTSMDVPGCTSDVYTVLNCTRVELLL